MKTTTQRIYKKVQFLNHDYFETRKIVNKPSPVFFQHQSRNGLIAGEGILSFPGTIYLKWISEPVHAFGMQKTINKKGEAGHIRFHDDNSTFWPQHPLRFMEEKRRFY